MKVPYDGNHGNFLSVDTYVTSVAVVVVQRTPAHSHSYSLHSTLIDDSRLTVFPVNGALGGACEACRQEARGGDGLVVFWSQNEYCDGQDNTYDGEIDENLPRK